MNPHVTQSVGGDKAMARRHRLAQRRKTVGLSQEGLAEIMGVDRTTVVRWERADNDPQPWHRPRLARTLRISIEELAQLLEDTDDPSRARPDERLNYVLEHPASVDLVAVAYLRDQVGQFDKQYDRTPSTLLLAQVGQVHGQITFLCGHALTSAVRRELWTAEAESATLMGQLVWDASQRRDHRSAVEYFDQAVVAARQIKDLAMEAHAELRKSYVALYGIGNPTTGLALARRASDVANSGSHIISGLAMLHLGEAEAMLGRETSCEQALGAAEEHFARILPHDPANLLYCPSQHARLAGSCWLSLGKPDKAETALNQSRQLLHSRNKSSAIVLGNLALASIRRRDIDGATARLHEAIDVVEQTRGGGGMNIVFSAARELRPWRNEHLVQDVNDRILTLMTAS